MNADWIEFGIIVKMIVSFFGVVMRYMLSALLFVVAQSVFADAYKCKAPGGQVVITAQPCDVGYQTARAARSDGTDAASYAQAQSDLQRQKAWLAGREEVKQQDAVIAQRQANDANQVYRHAEQARSNAGSIWEKHWGCWDSSCPTTTTKAAPAAGKR